MNVKEGSVRQDFTHVNVQHVNGQHLNGQHVNVQDQPFVNHVIVVIDITRFPKSMLLFFNIVDEYRVPNFRETQSHNY